MTHQEINQLFIKIENKSEIFEYEFCGWLVWPLIKERLWHSLLQSFTLEKQNSQIKFSYFKNLLFGFLEIFVNLFKLNRIGTGILYTPKPFKVGSLKLDAIFGETIYTDTFLHVIFGSHSHDSNRKMKGIIYTEKNTGFILKLASYPLRYLSRVQVTSRKISIFLSQFHELSRFNLPSNIASILSEFYIKMLFYGWIFKIKGLTRIYVLDPDAKSGEVVAAKRNNIEVIEVQHGMFSCEEPDYSWDHKVIQFKSKMAVPDKIYVFGKIWKSMLNKNNFWNESEVTIIKYPVLEHFKNEYSKRNKVTTTNNSKINILLPTQYYIQSHAIGLLRDFFKLLTDNRQSNYYVYIKIHPFETNLDSYFALRNDFPNFCDVVQSKINVLEFIVNEIDIVVGYTSMVLIEAIGMGVPVICIGGGSAEGGMIATFNLSDLEPYLTLVKTADDLLLQLDEMKNTSSRNLLISDIIYGPESCDACFDLELLRYNQ